MYFRRRDTLLPRTMIDNHHRPTKPRSCRRQLQNQKSVGHLNILSPEKTPQAQPSWQIMRVPKQLGTFSVNRFDNTLEIFEHNLLKCFFASKISFAPFAREEPCTQETAEGTHVPSRTSHQQPRKWYVIHLIEQKTLQKSKLVKATSHYLNLYYFLLLFLRKTLSLSFLSNILEYSNSQNNVRQNN